MGEKTTSGDSKSLSEDPLSTLHPKPLGEDASPKFECRMTKWTCTCKPLGCSASAQVPSDGSTHRFDNLAR